MLTAARIVTGDGGVSPSPAWVVVEDDRIVAVGSGAPPAAADGPRSSTIRMRCSRPAFVDVQVNGAGTVDFATASVDEIVAAIDELVAGGCTTCVPTIVSAPLDAVRRRCSTAWRRCATARPPAIGVHLEGPFLGGAPGAHPVELLRPVDLEWLLACCDRHEGLVRIVTLAPESDPELAATRALRDARHRRLPRSQHRDLRGIARRRRRGRADGHAPLQRHGAVAPPRAGVGRRRARRPAAGAVVHRGPRARAPGRVAHRARRPARRGARDRPRRRRSRCARRRGAARATARSRARSSPCSNPCSISSRSGSRWVRRCAPRPATRRAALGLTDRGRVAPGCRADLVWLDPGRSACRRVGRPPIRPAREHRAEHDEHHPHERRARRCARRGTRRRRRRPRPARSRSRPKPRAAPTRTSSAPIATNATPVPSDPSATTAASEPQAKEEWPIPTMPNGAVMSNASSWARKITGNVPYCCCSGTDTFAAKP